jgi:hypothetical protein
MQATSKGRESHHNPSSTNAIAMSSDGQKRNNDLEGKTTIGDFADPTLSIMLRRSGQQRGTQ